MNIEQMQQAMENHNKYRQWALIKNRNMVVLAPRPSWYYSYGEALVPEGSYTPDGKRFLCDLHRPFKVEIVGSHMLTIDPTARTWTIVQPRPWEQICWRLNHYLPSGGRIQYYKYNRYTPGQWVLTQLGRPTVVLHEGMVIREDGRNDGKRAIKIEPTPESGIRLRHAMKKLRTMLQPMDHWRASGPANHGSFSHEAMEALRKDDVPTRMKVVMRWLDKGNPEKYDVAVHLTVISFNPNRWREETEHHPVQLDECLHNLKRHLRAALCSTPL